MKRFLPALVVCFLAVSCSPIERTAYNTAVGAKAFLDTEKKAHIECAPWPSTSTAQWCVNINKAVASKDLLIDAISVYCSGPDFNNGGACNAPKKGTPGYQQAVDKLNAAIAAYNQVANDLKGTK